MPGHGTLLIGRDAEIAALRQALTAPGCLVTVLGPGGVGKTCLALEVARGLLAEGHAVAWCDLADARTALDLGVALSRALDLDLRDDASEDALLGHLAHGLAAREGLLVCLDNLEQLLPWVRGPLAAWRQRAPRIRWLGTSREPLRLPGETRLPIAPLALEDAVVLLSRLAGASAAAGLSADPGGAGSRMLAASLDGLPLHLELAAPWLQLFTPADLARRVASRLDLLDSRRGGRQGAAERSIAWSWELLDEPQRRALALASVFRGGFSADAFEAVLESGPDALGLLLDLQERHLVRARPGTGVGSPEVRFDLFDTIALFSSERRRASGLDALALSRHAAWFAGASVAWARDPSAAGLAVLGRERANLSDAFEHTVAAGDADAAAAIALALSRLLEAQGPRDLHGAMLDRAWALAGPLPDGTRAELAWARGRWARHAEKLQQALGELARAAQLALAAEDPLLRARLGVDRALALRELGRPDQAWSELEAALATFGAQGALREEAQALPYAAAWKIDEGDLALAEALAAAGLEKARALAEPWLEAVALNALGGIEVRRGRPTEARPLFERSFDIVTALGNRREAARVLGNLAQLDVELGAYADARRRLEHALALENALGLPRSAALVLCRLAVVDLLEDAPGAARVKLLGAMSRGSEGRWQAVFEGYLGLAQLLGGEPLAGIASLQRAVAALEAGRHATYVRFFSDALALARDPAAGPRLFLGLPPGGHEMALAGRLRSHLRPRDSASLAVGPEARWFRVGAAPRVDLGRRGPVRRVLRALCQARRDAPDQAVSLDELLAEGWPGQRVQPEAGAARVYVAISTLRKLGLGALLVTRDQGWLLDTAPALELEA